MTTRRHFVIPGLIVAALSLIWDLLVALVLHIPPGYATTTAADQTVTSQVFAIIAGDAGMAVVVFGLYFTLLFGRHDRPAEMGLPGRAARSNVPLQAAWIGASVVLVMFAAGFGVVELEGQTAPALVVPAQALAAGAQKDPLIVQVIGQQWQFTYRYPQYGGFETQQLRIPTGRLIQFDVTSLDVTHSFWAYQLGIKIDANQGVNNVGYTYVTKPTVIDVRCGELCGLWHGYMTNVGSQAGEALTPSAFASWLSYAKAVYGPEEKNLPKFALTYYPEPLQYGS
ncbi:MAG TPA: cytochrome c oxidase subunit II [Candidatus Dormibacteraeota bacterium]